MGLFRKKEAIVPQAADTKAEELAAVIMAAISAYEADQYKKTLNINKINRIAGTRPAWGIMGTTETIDGRF